MHVRTMCGRGLFTHVVDTRGGQTFVCVCLVLLAEPDPTEL